MLYRHIALALPSITSAARLYATSYPPSADQPDAAGLLTLDFDEKTLQISARSGTDCGVDPSWLEIQGRTLYCIDEAWGQPNGTLHSFEISSDGKLTHVGQALTLEGPVSSIAYGENKHGLAVAD